VLRERHWIGSGDPIIDERTRLLEELQLLELYDEYKTLLSKISQSLVR
jgi:hypothetical protein